LICACGRAPRPGMHKSRPDPLTLRPMNRYELTPVSRPCPVCANEDCSVLYRVGADDAAQHYVLREVHPDRKAALADHIRMLWKQASCEVVRCNRCTFCFAWPFVAGDARFYTLAYERTGFPKAKWEFDRTVESLSRLRSDDLPRDFSLLEVGAGDGAFVRQVTPALMPKNQIVCTEYSEYGAESIRNYGVECLQVDIRELPVESYANAFDVVCMFQVLEHMDRVHALFAQIGRISTPRAHLFIAVPNEKRTEFNELNGGLLDLPPNHVGRWNRVAFQVMADKHGWLVESHEIEPRSADGLAKHLIYRYIRRRQSPTSIANRVERVRSRPARRVLQALTIAAYTPASLPGLAKLATRPRFGSTQWVHMRKRS